MAFPANHARISALWPPTPDRPLDSAERSVRAAVRFLDELDRVIDVEALRLQIGHERAAILKTSEIMSESPIPLERIAAARLAGWLNGQAVYSILKRLLLDPYYDNDSVKTRAEDRPLELYGTRLTRYARLSHSLSVMCA